MKWFIVGLFITGLVVFVSCNRESRQAIAPPLDEMAIEIDLDENGVLGSADLPAPSRTEEPAISVGERAAEIPVASTSGTAGSGLIDFETPHLAVSRMIINPYVDSVTGVVFSVDPGTFGDAVVGLVRNSSTTACADPPSNDQKLGTGRSSIGNTIGLSGFPVKVTFPTTLEPPVVISYEAQMLAGARARIRLYGPDDRLLGTRIVVVEPPAGTCGFPGTPRARKVVSTASLQPVAYAIMDAPFDPVVFVVDDFSFEFADPVMIDIKPESEPNIINPKSHGVIPVAILGRNNFRAGSVDQSSLVFGPHGAAITHKEAHLEDVDDDGDMDLLAHFRTQETGIQPGDLEACLRGTLRDGTPFEACDAVVTVPVEGISIIEVKPGN